MSFSTNAPTPHASKRRKRKKPVIAYTRVSTQKQGASGLGRDGQFVAINAYAEREGLEIVSVFHDVCSGAGGLNLRRRDGLRRAIDEAKRLGVRILVNDASRLARNSDVLLSLCSDEGVDVIAATQQALITPSMTASAAKRAEHDRNQISNRTKAALGEKKAAGVLLGNRKNLPDAQKKAVASNQRRSEEIARSIADVLQELEDRGESSPTASRMADVLNERGILSGHGRPFSADTVRRPLRRAKAILEERQRDNYSDNPLYGLF